MILAVANLFVIKARIVLGAGVVHRVKVRMITLNQDATWSISPTGAAGHLRDQLKGALGGAKVRQLQTRIHRNHAHQRHVRKIVSLGERSEEHTSELQSRG